MNRRIKRVKPNLALLGLVLLVWLIMPFFMSGCEPGGRLTIGNLHSQEVGIYFCYVLNDGTTDEPAYQKTIQPKQTIEFGMTFIGPNRIKRIQAIDPSGKVVFSHDYKMADLDKIGWKIIIPRENSIESSDNVSVSDNITSR